MKIEHNSKICINYMLSHHLLYPHNIFKDINKSEAINKIKSILETDNTLNYSLDIEATLPQLKLKTDPPMVFILFLVLDKCNLLKPLDIELSDNIFNTLPTFIEWYNKNQHLLPLNKIKNIVKTSKIPDVNELYDIIYEPTEEYRKILHNELYTNPFVPLKILNNMEYTELIYYKYVFTNKNIVVHVYRPINTDNIDINILSKIFDYYYKLTKKDIPINLVLYLGTLKKQLYPYNTQISPCNVNSGSTQPGIKICLWLKEEIYKVLIHELNHYFRLDFTFSTPGYQKTVKFVENLFNFNSTEDERLFESYTEALALITHCCFVNYYTKIDLQYLLLLELSFSFLQIAKLLTSFNITNAQEIFNKKSKNKISQSTSMISYFIIKTSLVFNINNFIKFIDEDVIFNDRIDEYIELVKSSVTDKNFLSHINCSFNYIKNCDHPFMKKTLRMTCIQIDKK